ncbi:helix-turn-helix domain-containing protein [Paenibacillus eucommiae]|uniref:YesN/AraC family two-component response regulator n=1 Tax=Paenibacillus eucommiae TaxID=1355755 RepID=A0ABS4IYE9_9BACL|nr:helix-turn-helix domain-containing protein [Paenibacillus eucommiae]MBP1992095.1 YesN/AraC family two-component response regulator [Paenibacillus eucommiae]
MISKMRMKRNSLFVKLLLSFMVIVLISFLFNTFSFNFFQSNLRKEIITYNTLNMSNTVNNYEKQFRLLDDVATQLFFNADVAILEKGRSNFFAMNRLTKEINTILSNTTSLNLENLFLYNDTYNFIIDKSGLTQMEEMHESYYISDTYNADFWKQQADGDYHMRIFPAALFHKKSFNGIVGEAGVYFPVVIKNKLQKRIYFAALIKANEIYREFHFSVNDMFYIADDLGKLFYSTAPQEMSNLALSADQHVAYDEDKHNYYFYEKGEYSGLTYVNVLPNQQIAAKITRLSFILLILLVLSVALSLLSSVLLSIRFKSPVQRMLESLQKMNPNFQVSSTINEFNQIGDSVRTIIASNQQIHSDLQKKDSLLKKYGYLTKVKSIPIGSKDVQNLIDTTKPFYFVMFQLHFTSTFHESLPKELNWNAYFLEFINLSMQQSFAQSETLQIEKDLIAAIIFTENDALTLDALTETLLTIKKVFDQDLEHYYITMAANLQLRNPSEFTNAYEETMGMLRERKLNAATQIITELPVEQNDFHLSPVDAQELSSHIKAGHTADILLMIRRLLQQLSKNGKAFAYKQMASEVISQILLSLMTQKIEVSELMAEGPLSLYEQVNEFVSEEQYMSFYTSLVEKAVYLIDGKKADKDPIVDYVLAYMERHYSEDISQEAIAGKLNISVGYMAKYIKNKTGQTFSDYLEDIRIRKAKSILEETDDKIHEVAVQVGYHNANSFTRMFRRITGSTPNEYRLEQRTGK